MTNDLTAQHCTAIEDAEYEVIKHSDIYKIDFDKATTSCAAITVEWMKGFSEWIAKSRWKYEKVYGVWYNSSLQCESSTNELINLYFEHLNKKQ